MQTYYCELVCYDRFSDPEVRTIKINAKSYDEAEWKFSKFVSDLHKFGNYAVCYTYNIRKG